MAIPGFENWLTEFLNDSLAYYLVWPKKVIHFWKVKKRGCIREWNC